MSAPAGYTTPKCIAITAVISQPQSVLMAIGHFVKAGVALSGAGSAVAMQRQYQAGKRVVDRVQTAHCVYPARYRRWSVVDLVHDIHVESFASFLVVLMTRHE
jgi:hypothetical protein